MTKKKIIIKDEDLKEIFDENNEKKDANIIEIENENEKKDEKSSKKTEEPMTEEAFTKNMLRVFLVSYTSFQSARIGSMNEIRDIIRKRLENIGFLPETKKEDSKKKEKKYTDKEIMTLWQKAISENKINEREQEYMAKCFEIALKMKKEEDAYKKIMYNFLEDHEIYNRFLSHIRGIAEISTANLIKWLGNCENFPTTSRLWAYCGYAVVENKAPKRKKGEKLKFNPKLRSIVWNISTCLMKLNHGYYRNVYDTEKEKQLNKTYESGDLFKTFGSPYKESDIHLTKYHAHNRALRKIAKLFLSHYWECAREIAGLPSQKTFVEGVLGHQNIVSFKKAIALEGTYNVLKAKNDNEEEETENITEE